MQLSKQISHFELGVLIITLLFPLLFEIIFSVVIVWTIEIQEIWFHLELEDHVVGIFREIDF